MVPIRYGVSKMNGQRVLWLGGVARSGTSWLGQIFNSHPAVRFRFQPLFAYEFKKRINEDSSADEYAEFLNELWDSDTEFLTQADKVRTGEYPQFEASGSEQVLAFKENRYQSVIEPLLRRIDRAHFIGLIRHPCAVINSWSKNSREFPDGSILRDEWRFASCKNNGPEDYFGFYRWKEVANLYLDLQEKWPDRALVIRFEELVRHRVEVCHRLFRLVGLELDDQTSAFLDQSGSQHSGSYYSVYKSPDVVDCWQRELDPYITSEIHADLAGTRLARFLDE